MPYAEGTCDSRIMLSRGLLGFFVASLETNLYIFPKGVNVSRIHGVESRRYLSFGHSRIESVLFSMPSPHVVHAMPNFETPPDYSVHHVTWNSRVPRSEQMDV